jgi:GTP-binding protein Era
MSFRAGVVAVVGKPNVGKSTLVNTVVGHKVSIVSNKVQTTRRRTMGVATTDDWQIVFVDTPGVHAPHHKLGKALNETARRSVQDVDVLLVMVDGSKPPSPDDRSLAAMLVETGALKPERTVLCLNKMDLLKAEYVQTNYDAYSHLFPASEVMMTSLTKRQNVDLLVGLLVSRLPEGPPLYDADTLTDQSMRAIAAELVREKALNLTREEVPHALATYVEGWEEDERLATVSIVLLVERDGQKRILIGKKGEMLKKIGQEARLEIEDLIGKKVYLELFVKVREGWRDNPSTLRELEYL